MAKGKWFEMKKITSKFVDNAWVIRVVLSLPLVLLILLAVWLYAPVNIIDFSPQPFSVLTKEVKAGSDVIYRYHYCKYANYQLNSVTKYLLDGQVITLTSIEERTPLKLGCGDIMKSTHIPITVLSDTYRLKIVSEFQVNPVRTVTITTYTEPFKIIESE